MAAGRRQELGQAYTTCGHPVLPKGAVVHVVGAAAKGVAKVHTVAAAAAPRLEQHVNLQCIAIRTRHVPDPLPTDIPLLDDAQLVLVLL